MAFTRTNRQNRGYGKRDVYGNETKNVFCKENQSKNGTIGYKGYFEINGRLYSVYFKDSGAVENNKGVMGKWAAIVEYKNR